MESTPDRPCILLVDDHPDTLTLQAILLRRDGYHVVTAENAETALALAAANDIDLVVSDLRLPDRSGMDLMRDLHQRHGLRGVAMTGAAEDGQSAARADVGFVEILIKPVVPERLVQVIESAISANGGTPS